MNKYIFIFYDINDKVIGRDTVRAESESKARHIVEHSSSYDYEYYEIIN